MRGRRSRNAGSSMPSHWWQWLLVYPALLIALFTAVPEWLKVVKSFKEDLPVARVDDAEYQKGLWLKNGVCTPVHAYTGLTSIKADADVCHSSGDVLVSLSFPDSNKSYYWVGADRLIKTPSSDDNSPTALGPTRGLENILAQAAQPFVMCQRFPDQRNLLRVVNVGDSCFDEIVDTYTGQVMSQNPSVCRQSC